jgi:threonine dehydrogenase-like Zn-dependent dehydrogenase
MRTAVLTAPGVVELREVAVPSPAAHQVLLRVEGCGICGSNLPPWEGRPWFEYPFAPGKPGHEAWGRIAAVGSAVRGLREGDRVACLSERAFAEYDLAEAPSVVPLPSSLDRFDVPLEALGCVMNVWGRSGVRSEQSVAIVGVGFLGALLVQLAAGTPANVVALARRPCSLELARSAGARACVTIEASIEETAQRALAANGGRAFDCVIEAAGTQQALDLASRLGGVRSRLVIAGYHQDGPRTVDMQSWNWRGLDVINAHERSTERYVDGMQQALDALADRRLDITPLITHREPLENLSGALSLLSSRPDGFVKAVVVP